MQNNDTLIYKIAITLVDGIGVILARKLIERCGSPKAVFSEKKSHLEKIKGIGGKVIKAIQEAGPMKRAEEEMLFISKHSIQPMFYQDKNFPARLGHCVDHPLMIYYKGNAELNCPKVVSIVGTRNATTYGKRMCQELMEVLAYHRVLVISGLAYGIDITAHRQALKSDLKTVGVLAHGLDRIYPSVHRSTAKEMLSSGGLLTEFVSQTNPDRENFPKRNRIIAGLSDATIIIEAGQKGGALITGELANSYDREVLAVPGRVGDKFSKGCNYLIKTNRAALIENGEDIEYIMNWERKEKTKKKIKDISLLTGDERVIANLLEEQNGAVTLEVLIQKSGLNSSEIAPTVLNMELNGYLEVLPGKRYQLC